MNTRGLTGLASSRIADAPVSMIYNVLTLQDDGSSKNDPVIDELYGSVKALQPIEIQRLQEGGIEVKNAVSILVAGARKDRPDKIIAYDKTWRVVNWSFSFEYIISNGGSGHIARGTVVAICDEMLVGAA